MALLNLTMEPSMANVTDVSFFEEIVRAFMELDSRPETALPCTIYVAVNDNIGIGIPTRLGRLGPFRPCPNCASVAVPTTLTMPLLLRDDLPTDFSEIMQLCDKPPLLRELYYRFSYHFCNHRIGRKLFMDFFYWSEPDDIRGWVMMRYGVDSTICYGLVGRPLRRLHVVLHGDVLLDTLALLNCDGADTVQLVCRSWRRSVDANPSVLPLRQLAQVQVETVAPELCRVICRPSSIAFAFRRHVSFHDLGLFLHDTLKRSRITLLKLNGDLDKYISFGFLDALSSSTFVEELRLDFRCDYKAETLVTLCTEAVNVWNTTVLGLYNPLHSQMIFGDAQITRKLSRLEVSVPTTDCRRDLDALLFGNPHLEVRLQFVFGQRPIWGFTTCIEESFFVHYFESVFRRISYETRDGDFVRVLYIRSTFEFFAFMGEDVATVASPLDDSGFLQGIAGVADDEGLQFIVYDAGSASRRYKVFWGSQDFYDFYGYTGDNLDYYVITTSIVKYVSPIGPFVKPTGARFALLKIGGPRIWRTSQ